MHHWARIKFFMYNQILQTITILDWIYSSLEVCPQILAVEFRFEIYLALQSNLTGIYVLTYSPTCVYLNHRILAFCGFNGFLCACSFRKSASRLICHIALSTITTRAPHSATTVAVCCGVSTDRASNVKVSLMCSLSFFFLKCYICRSHFDIFLFHCVPFLYLAFQTVAWMYIVTVRRKWPICVESTRKYWQRLCLKCLRFAQ